MDYIPTTVNQVEELRQKAELLRGEGRCTHIEVLDRVARDAGYRDWYHVEQCMQKTVRLQIDEIKRAAGAAAITHVKESERRLGELEERERSGGAPFTHKELDEAMKPSRSACEVVLQAAREVAELRERAGESGALAELEEQLAGAEARGVRLIETKAQGMLLTSSNGQDRGAAISILKAVDRWAAVNEPKHGLAH